jgi:CO/xanthine dehydrogenase FAD-binding subunit
MRGCIPLAWTLTMVSRFEYFSPRTLEETLDLLAQKKGTSKILAGGTDLLNGIQQRMASPSSLLSLRKIPSLHHQTFEPDRRELRVGSMTTLTEIVTSPLVLQKLPMLADAAASVGSMQIRNRGTLGGNICNASPAADTVPALLVLRSKAILTGPGATRVVPLEDFFLGPGKTTLREDEILTEMRIPLPPEGSKGVYLKQGIRKAMDIAIVGVAVLIDFTSSKRKACRDIHIALGSVAPTPLRAFGAEEMMKGKTLDDDIIRGTARKAGDESHPISDIRASAEYRKELVVVLTERAIRKAIGDGSPNP